MTAKHEGFNSSELGFSMRERAIRPLTGEVFLAKIPPAEVEKSQFAHINCDGYGLVRKSVTSRDDWPKIDILPEVASSRLGIPVEDAMATQIFRDGICNYRCWYCFVDFRYLTGNPQYGSFVTPDRMVEMYQNQSDRPSILYLTGGQPDLLPEWPLWTMKALEKRGLDSSTYLWQDDNLSSDFLWRYVDREGIDYMRNNKNYGRSACLKGFSKQSFYENTGSAPANFETQVDVLGRLVKEGFDIYPYLIMLTTEIDAAQREIPQLMDRLRGIHENLPLKVFPSKVVEFDQTSKRIDPKQRTMMQNQHAILDIWLSELDRRYTSQQISQPKSQISLS